MHLLALHVLGIPLLLSSSSRLVLTILSSTLLPFICSILTVSYFVFFFFSSRRRHTRSLCDWSSDVCSSDLEPKPDRPVQLAFKHREFRELVRATLKTDAQGRVHLGPLADIVNVSATGPEGDRKSVV